MVWYVTQIYMLHMYADSDSIRYSGDQYKGRKRRYRKCEANFPTSQLQIANAWETKKRRAPPQKSCKNNSNNNKMLFFYKIKKNLWRTKHETYVVPFWWGNKQSKQIIGGKVCASSWAPTSRKKHYSAILTQKKIKKNHKQLNQIKSHSI